MTKAGVEMPVIQKVKILEFQKYINTKWKFK